MVKIIGYEKKKGTFTNSDTGELIDYDNVLFYGIANDNPTVTGEYSFSLKVKTSELDSVLLGRSPDDLIGEVVTLTYVPRGNRTILSSIQV